MQIRESKTMQEIHEIREELYEEMKDLPIEERFRRMEENALEYVKNRNLKVNLVKKY